MRVHESLDGEFDLFLTPGGGPAVTLDVAELVELRAAIDRALMDYLARNVARLVQREGGPDNG